MHALQIDSESGSDGQFLFSRGSSSSAPQSRRRDQSISASMPKVAWAPFEDLVREQFEQLAIKWRVETAHVSQIERRVMHPSYQQIIAMGRQALPYILLELTRQPDHWFWALRALTREDPIPPNFRGSPTDAAKLWISWVKAAGYI